ncbi:RWD domain containing [Perkinsus chesapeaki]|uniref:RWD domain containing n=1 Tax=Perkinsus chesapeaki TaxID=330153 RepID=A0A7J6N174_PERCH|nr:RWD domain containing [Perkinsus chesapeaki]
MSTCFDLQLRESEALSAAYGSDFMWLHQPDNEDDGDEMTYAITFTNGYDDETSATVMVTLPHGYPTNDGAAFPEIVIAECSADLSARSRKLQDAIASNVKAQLRSGYEFPILAALAPIPALISKFAEEWKSEQYKGAAGEPLSTSRAAAAAETKEAKRRGPPILGRRIIFFHHIRSPYKRRCIQQWAKELRLGGMSKIGFPGCIVVEGDEQDVTDYVNMVYKLNWRYMDVRGDEQIPVPPGKELDDMRKLPIEFHEYGKDELNAVADKCREAGLEDLFLTYMQIYRGKESSAKN